MFFHLNPTNRRPPTETTTASSAPLDHGTPHFSDQYCTPEPRARPNPGMVLHPEQDASPISPLSPPPRFSSSRDSSPASSPRSPSFPCPTQGLMSYRTTDRHGFGEGGSRASTSGYSGSNHRPNTAGSGTATESERFYKFQDSALSPLWTPSAPTSRVRDQPGARFIPLEAIVPAPRPVGKISPTTSAVDPPTRSIRIPDTPPQIPISIFVDPPPRGCSKATASPTSPLAPTIRSSSPVSQYESFTPTFGARPLPPLPAASRRATYTSTSTAPSEWTSSPSISPVSPKEDETAVVAQLEARW
jgi:hypothetical protein